MGKVLSRDDILKVQDIKRETVDVSEWWGGEVIVKALTGRERDEFELTLSNVGQPGVGQDDVEYNFQNMRAKLVAMSCVDETDHRLFTLEDAAALGEKNAAPLDRIFAVAQRLSGISKEDVEKLKKGLGKGPSAGSGSSSHSQ